MEIISMQSGKPKRWVRALRLFQAVTSGFFIYFLNLFIKMRVNTDLLLALGCLLLAIVIEVILKNRPKVSEVGRTEFKIPRQKVLSAEEGNAMSRACEQKLKELFEKYQTTDINDSRVQQEFKEFVRTVSLKAGK